MEYWSDGVSIFAALRRDKLGCGNQAADAADFRALLQHSNTPII